MTIALRISYQALWGSEVFVYTGKKVQEGGHVPTHAIAMENDGHGNWFTEVEGATLFDKRYHYAIAHQRIIVAAEWGKGHLIEARQLDSKAGCLHIWNTWLVAPNDLAFHTLGFTQGIFRHPQPKLLPLPAPDTLTFRIEAATIRPEHKLALIGSIPELGEWDTSRAIVAEPDGLPFWRVTIDRTHLHYPIYYKFILVDGETGNFVAWEDRPNRFFQPTAFYPGDMLIVDDLRFANPIAAWHGIGVKIDLNHIRSHESCAIGEFADIKTIIDWAVLTGLKVIQLQPVNDCGLFSKDPYRVSSGFALDYRYLRPTDAGILNDPEQMERYNHRREVLNELPKVKLVEICELKSVYLCALFQQEGEKTLQSEAFNRFAADNSWWLNDCCQFIAEKSAEEENLTLRDARFYQFVQFHLAQQLQAIRDYAREKGVLLMGTTPYGIHKHSVDAELYRKYYNLGLRESHSYISKVRQQRSTHPTFNWFALENSNYELLHQRMKVIARYFDACDPEGLLGIRQETSEFWQIIAEKAFEQLKESSPILLSTPKEVPAIATHSWWETRNEICKILQASQGFMTILPFEYWLMLSEEKRTTAQSIEKLTEDKDMNEIIKTILITNKLLY